MTLMGVTYTQICVELRVKNKQFRRFEPKHVELSTRPHGGAVSTIGIVSYLAHGLTLQ